MEKNGFLLLKERELKEVDGKARLWQHKVTKACVVSIMNHDENKCFGVTFRTPPADSTGVAHIMEHSVLCGSEKYPVKEPFVELLKGSLQTFLNAFTFPDKTCYPVASANLQDFYNLIDVYLDAVFHPRISEDIFRQEGWHLEAPGVEEEWSYKGVVFNEMKGSYSSPDSVLSEESQHAIFPDTLYSLDSGGDPDVIPELSYADFHAFHDTYYHPSNARFFFWGDDPEEKRLEILEEALQGYEYKAIDSAIPLQKPFDSPRLREVAYAAGSSEQKAMFTTSWLLGERGNVYEALLMQMLAHILEGMPGSPLRRALISSGLGEDIVGQGLETNLRQMYYSTGLKGIRSSDISRAETIIFDTLGELADKGIDKNVVEAAVNTVEFSYREANTGHFPRGLAAMVHALSTWLYDEDPLKALAWEEPLAEIKERLRRGERVFEEAITHFFLENTHRSTVVLLPDLDLAKKREEKEAERVAQRKNAFSSQEKEKIVEETKHLKEAQATPDKAEDIAKIPALKVEDLPLKNSVIPQKEEKDPFLSLLHEQPTHGIAYTSLLIPIDNLPQKLLPLLPLFLRSLIEIGTARHDYSALGALIAAKTGGIAPDLFLGTHHVTRKFFSYFGMNGKAVYDKAEDLFALFQEILFEPQHDATVATERIGQMLLESRSRFQEILQMAGNAIARTRLNARYNEASAFVEITGGVTYFEALQRFLQTFKEDPKAILDDLSALREMILDKEGFLFSVTAEADQFAMLSQKCGTLYAMLGHRKEKPETPPLKAMKELPDHEAFIIPSRVNYVGKSINLFDLGWKYHGSASVILRYMRMGYLWDTVRVRGGAYGVSCSLERSRGTLTCSSYRDPNVAQTLKAYDGMADYLAHFTPNATQLTQAIVGAIGDLDLYQLPSARGDTALIRYLTGDTEERRQKMRDEILGTSAKDFRDFAEVIAELRNGAVCVVGGSDAEEWAREGGWSVKKLL